MSSCVKLCKSCQRVSVLGQIVLRCEGCTPVLILACSVFAAGVMHATYHVLFDYTSSARCHAIRSDIICKVSCTDIPGVNVSLHDRSCDPAHASLPPNITSAPVSCAIVLNSKSK